MRKTRGFKIGKRLVQICRWFTRKARTPCEYHRLTQTGTFWNSKALTKFFSWGRRLTNGAKSICSVKFGSGYIPIDEDPINGRPIEVPKGHLAVYVDQNNGDFHRVLVPVIYFNHALFGELLREAEKEYGYNPLVESLFPAVSRSSRGSKLGSLQEPVVEGKRFGSATIDRLLVKKTMVNDL
ncbi:hypothetical protein GQ457_02G000280 [Hibiscus cannabinus]